MQPALQVVGSTPGTYRTSGRFLGTSWSNFERSLTRMGVRTAGRAIDARVPSAR
jgi:hypothetical protein